MTKKSSSASVTGRTAASVPLGVARHVPGDVVDAVLGREELVEVEHRRVQLLAQDLLVFPLFTFLNKNDDSC